VNNSIIPEDYYLKVLYKRKSVFDNINGINEEFFDYLNNKEYWNTCVVKQLNTVKEYDEQT
jgi:hypothetical protein